MLIIDTAGRLHNKKNLMEELRKIQRVINREAEGCNREVYLVLTPRRGKTPLRRPGPSRR